MAQEGQYLAGRHAQHDDVMYQLRGGLENIRRGEEQRQYLDRRFAQMPAGMPVQNHEVKDIATTAQIVIKGPGNVPPILINPNHLTPFYYDAQDQYRLEQQGIYIKLHYGAPQLDARNNDRPTIRQVSIAFTQPGYSVSGGALAGGAYDRREQPGLRINDRPATQPVMYREPERKVETAPPPVTEKSKPKETPPADALDLGKEADRKQLALLSAQRAALLKEVDRMLGRLKELSTDLAGNEEELARLKIESAELLNQVNVRDREIARLRQNLGL
jgi:hypothetical protein